MIAIPHNQNYQNMQAQQAQNRFLLQKILGNSQTSLFRLIYETSEKYQWTYPISTKLLPKTVQTLIHNQNWNHPILQNYKNHFRFGFNVIQVSQHNSPCIYVSQDELYLINFFYSFGRINNRDHLVFF